jgi:hypothetical protein
MRLLFANTTAEPLVFKPLEAWRAALPQRVVKAHPAPNNIHYDMVQVLSLLRVTYDYLEPL